MLVLSYQGTWRHIPKARNVNSWNIWKKKNISLLADSKVFSTFFCVKNACNCLSLEMQVPGPSTIRRVRSIGEGTADRTRLWWLEALRELTYQWQMTALLSIFPVYRKGSPWQPVLCLWFRPHKTLVATSCDENRKSLKLQQKPFVCLLWPLAFCRQQNKANFNTTTQVRLRLWPVDQKAGKRFSLLFNYKQ